MTREIITGIIGIALMLIFLGILIWWIKALPLIVITIVVSVLMIYDFYLTVRDGTDTPPDRRR